MSLDAAYIVPHPPLAVAKIGGGNEAGIANTLAAYNEISQRIARHKPDTIVFINPHSAYYSDWIFVAGGPGSSGDFSDFGAGDITFSLQYDESFREALLHEVKRRSIPAGIVDRSFRNLDHGLMVPLYFIEKNLATSEFEAVSIGGSGLPSETLIEFGRCIARCALASKEKIIIVASGDLSHKLKSDGPYGFDPAGPIFDETFGAIVRDGQTMAFAEIDPQIREYAAECGLSGFIMLAGALDEIERLTDRRFSSELLSLEGPFGVGYGVAAFEPPRKISHMIQSEKEG